MDGNSLSDDDVLAVRTVELGATFQHLSLSNVPRHQAAPRPAPSRFIKYNVLKEPVHALAPLRQNDTTKATRPSFSQRGPIITLERPVSKKPMQMILMGTGASAAVPDISCVTNPATGCAGCLKTLEKGGEKNVRGNTGAIIRVPQTDGSEKVIMIDCGKTFREQALKLFPKNGLRRIDAVILTRASALPDTSIALGPWLSESTDLHADAVDGLDDLRAWTISNIQRTVPIYCTKTTYDYLEQAFPFLVNKAAASGSGKVAALEWHIFHPMQILHIPGIRITPLPVHHGVYFDKPGKPPLICCGFLINSSVLYMSDVSWVPEWVYKLVLANELDLPDPVTGKFANRPQAGLKSKPRLQALIIDGSSLVLQKSHWGLPQALEMAHRLGADRTYLTDIPHGTSHECWLYACTEFSKGRTSKRGAVSSNLSDDDDHHQAASFSRDLKRHVEKDIQVYDRYYDGIANSHVEDFELFTERALESIEDWNGGPLPPRKVWPAVDGMTVTWTEGNDLSWSQERVWDSEYH